MFRKRNRNPSLLIAVVEDDDSVRKALGRLLNSFGMDAEVFASGRAFLEVLEKLRPDCLVLDVRMPDFTGLQLQAHLDSVGIRLPIVFISASGTTAQRARALAGGATAFLRKPFADHELLDAIQRATEDSGGTATPRSWAQSEN